jgi:hypothetical protein
MVQVNNIYLNVIQKGGDMYMAGPTQMEAVGRVWTRVSASCYSSNWQSEYGDRLTIVCDKNPRLNGSSLSRHGETPQEVFRVNAGATSMLM